MADEQVQVQEEQVQQQTEAVNFFDDSAWSSEIPQDPEGSATTEVDGSETTETVATTTETPTEEQPKESAQQESSLQGVEVFLKELGYEKADDLKNAIQEYKELKSKPATSAIDESKLDELYDYLSKKKEIEKFSSLEITDRSTALSILKAKFKNDYKELSDDEIDFKLAKTFKLPKAPQQRLDELDEDFAERQREYEAEVDDINKQLIIEAKLAKPSLQNLANELKLPDVFKVDAPTQPSQEELDKAEKARQAYLQSLENSFKAFDGYKIAAKDEDVDVAVSYVVNNDEKTKLKQTLESFDADSFLGSLWISQDGNINTQLAMEDVYLLQNKQKVFQKIANEAIAQFKLGLIQQKKNISFGNNSSANSSSITEEPFEVGAMRKFLENA